jgi:Mor family transcriptional regulator
MPYFRGEVSLPPELLREVQKYVQGALLYIPRPPRQRAGWGRQNGAREALDLRDQSIREARARGVSLEELAEDYSLSVDAIRKVLFRAKAGPRA